MENLIDYYISFFSNPVVVIILCFTYILGFVYVLIDFFKKLKIYKNKESEKKL